MSILVNPFQIFKHPKFKEIRGLLIDGNPWFVGKEVALALSYSNPQKAIRDHVNDEDKGVHSVDTLGGKQAMTVINESGLYSLIFASKMPDAKEFKRWVTNEVLPSIRKMGLITTLQVIQKLFQSVDDADVAKKCVYILGMSNDTVKVGITQQDVLKRSRQVETGSGLTVGNRFHTEKMNAEDAQRLERICHQIFAKNRTLGEFFNMPFDEACAELKHQFNLLAGENIFCKTIE